MSLVFLFVTSVFASELDDSALYQYHDHPQTPSSSPKIERYELLQLVADYATIYDVSFQEMVNTIECESGFVTDIQSRHTYPDGSRERSFGLVQIHLPAHPNVTYEQAINAEFSIKFMAEKFAAGDKHLWTCWRELYGT